MNIPVGTKMIVRLRENQTVCGELDGFMFGGMLLKIPNGHGLLPDYMYIPLASVLFIRFPQV